jgi:hypothetical protein
LLLFDGLLLLFDGLLLLFDGLLLLFDGLLLLFDGLGDSEAGSRDDGAFVGRLNAALQ